MGFLPRQAAGSLSLDLQTRHGPNGSPLTLGSLRCEIPQRGGAARCGQPVKRLWADMGVAAQHLPVLVAGDQRDLLDGEAGLEQAASAFVAQIVEMQVLYADLHAGPSEGGSDRPRVVGKDAAFCAPQFLGLF